MVSIDTNTRVIDGVTLVTVHLTGDGVARRIRLVHRLDGAVWPPRREGEPEPGWDERGYEGVVPAEGLLALGYATPAPPEQDPVSVEAATPVRSDADSSTIDEPAGVLQRLGDPLPPRDAVPLSSADDTDHRVDGEPDNRPGTELAVSTRSKHDEGTDFDSDELVPDPVTGWLGRVEQRVAIVEQLDAAESVPDATAAVRSAGGLEPARRARRATEADRRRLLAVADRAERLAERIETTDPPLATLERLR
jgi:hypothetical protein